MQLRKKGSNKKSTTLDRPSAILKNRICKLLKIGTKSIGTNSKVPLVIVQFPK